MNAVEIENLGKRYKLGHKRPNRDGLRHTLEHAVRHPLSWLRTGSESSSKMQQKEHWALRNVSLAIQPGEVVGIIGRNGAGKSTLLKLLSRITVPTEGRIRVNGRIASLLEVGTGFHQELTGRENIFLNGAILGMSRREIIRKFDEIVAFSEVEEFLDTPVKRYSSGMYVRLAFAVAAHLDPEILIIDEVLAVGDIAFQRKCLGKMGSFAQTGRTVLFVSHNLDAVRSLCQRVIWLKDGKIQKDGEVTQVIDSYQTSVASETCTLTNPDCGFTIEKVILKDDHGRECGVFRPGEDLVVEISYFAETRVEWPFLAIGVVGANGSCFTSNMLLDGCRPEYLEGSGKIRCTFRSIPLLPQEFTVKLRVQSANPAEIIIPYQDVAYFSVAGDLAEYGYRGEFWRWTRNSTAVVVPYEWQLPDGKSVSVSLQRSAELEACLTSRNGDSKE